MFENAIPSEVWRQSRRLWRKTIVPIENTRKTYLRSRYLRYCGKRHVPRLFDGLKNSKHAKNSDTKILQVKSQANIVQTCFCVLNTVNRISITMFFFFFITGNYTYFGSDVLPIVNVVQNKTFCVKNSRNLIQKHRITIIIR